MLSIVVALAKPNNAIGKNNDLLWKIPEDLRHFRELTMGHPIIMGRKTYESIGRPLPGRKNIVITRDPEWQKKEGISVVPDITSALELGKKENKGEIFVIGGGQIYKQTLALAQRLYVTLVEGNYPEATIFFPTYEEMFNLVSEKELQTKSSGILKFQIWEKKRYITH